MKTIIVLLSILSVACSRNSSPSETAKVETPVVSPATGITTAPSVVVTPPVTVAPLWPVAGTVLASSFGTQSCAIVTATNRGVCYDGTSLTTIYPIAGFTIGKLVVSGNITCGLQYSGGATRGNQLVCWEMDYQAYSIDQGTATGYAFAQTDTRDIYVGAMGEMCVVQRIYDVYGAYVQDETTCGNSIDSSAYGFIQ